MTAMERERAREMTLCMVGLAGALGLVSAVTSVHGWMWTAIRIVVFVIFVLSVAAWLAAARRRRQQH
jgi:CHASE2 domain-containing sensor protein